MQLPKHFNQLMNASYTVTSLTKCSLSKLGSQKGITVLWYTQARWQLSEVIQVSSVVSLVTQALRYQLNTINSLCCFQRGFILPHHTFFPTHMKLTLCTAHPADSGHAFFSHTWNSQSLHCSPCRLHPHLFFHTHETHSLSTAHPANSGHTFFPHSWNSQTLRYSLCRCQSLGDRSCCGNSTDRVGHGPQRFLASGSSGRDLGVHGNSLVLGSSQPEHRRRANLKKKKKTHTHTHTHKRKLTATLIFCLFK